MSERMDFDATAEALTEGGKRPPHYLAMDQSGGTHKKHFAQFGAPWSDDNGKEIRRVIATTPNLGDHYGAAIVHSDLYDLQTADGVPLQQELENRRVIVIGKLLGLNEENGLATGMETLDADMQGLVDKGVHAVKTRVTFTAGMPDELVDAGVEQLVAIQKAAATNGKIMPILEPEFLWKNTRGLEDNAALMQVVLTKLQQRLNAEGVQNHPWVLKTSFAAPGKDSGEPVEPEASAEAFGKVLDASGLPAELPVRFLSGGHPTVNSRLLLQANNTRLQLERDLGSSFSRADLQGPYQAMFANGTLNPEAAQAALRKQGALNRVAMQGKYRSDLEEDGVTYQQVEQLLD